MKPRLIRTRAGISGEVRILLDGRMILTIVPPLPTVIRLISMSMALVTSATTMQTVMALLRPRIVIS